MSYIFEKMEEKAGLDLLIDVIISSDFSREDDLYHFTIEEQKFGYNGLDLINLLLLGLEKNITIQNKKYALLDEALYVKPSHVELWVNPTVLSWIDKEVYNA